MVKHSKKIYKTIRHGENSLQYTILPQNDDFRLEGRIKSVASGKRSGVASNTAVRPRSRARRSFFAYLGVLFICTILVGAVLIPFLVSTECLPNPTEWFLRTKAALMHRGLELAFVGRNNASISAINPSNINQTMMESSTVSTAVTEAATIITMATTVTSDPSNPTEGLRSLSASRDEKDKLVLQLNRLNATTTTTTTTTIAPPNQLIDMNSIGSTHASGKSAVKESSIPASIASVAMTTSPVDKNAIEHQRNMAWIQGHWPYIDPSTYFQWNGYKMEDNVLLPALLGFALIGLIFTVIVCFLARRRRSFFKVLRRRNLRHQDMEGGGTSGDKTTLLTTGDGLHSEDEE